MVVTGRFGEPDRATYLLQVCLLGNRQLKVLSMETGEEQKEGTMPNRGKTELIVLAIESEESSDLVEANE